MSDTKKKKDESLLEEAKEQIEELKEKLRERELSWKRALADYQNLQRRTAEEKQVFVEFGNKILIQRLLPILDNLKLAAKHKLDEGMDMIVKQFEDLLREEGVIKIEAEGKKFDPQTMEAVETDDKELEESGVFVKEVVKDGYVYKDKVLRAAQVRVGSED